MTTIRSLKIRLKDKHILSYMKHKIFLTQHFENMMIILINQDINQNNGQNYKYLINPRIMRAVITDNKGGILEKEVNYIQDYYKDNDLMIDIKNVCKELKIHNITEQIKNIKKNYASFFTKIQNQNYDCNKPTTKSLKTANHITLYMDGYKSNTLKHKNLIGLNLDKKMIYTHVRHEPIIKVVKSLKNIKNINLNYSNGFIYMILNYDDSEKISQVIHNEREVKYAGLDIGIKNIASIYINDSNSNSLLISGKPFIKYNSSFNRLCAKIDKEINNTTDINRIHYLRKFQNFLYEKRKQYFFSEFHKLSKEILKYLQQNKVTHFVVSKKIAELKNNGLCKIDKTVKQHFLQIPLIQLINNICNKAADFNIHVILIDEGYTSKTSSISRNIHDIKKLSLNNKLSTDDFGGRRVKRGLFKDYTYNKIINCDLNGAFNILKLGMIKPSPTYFSYKKLCNPIKIKCESDLIDLLQLVV